MYSEYPELTLKSFEKIGDRLPDDNRRNFESYGAKLLL